MNIPARTALRRLRIVWVVLAAVLVIATHACRAPTEVTVKITTELPCSTLKGVSIVVAPDPLAAEERARTRYFAAQTDHCDSDSVVGTLVLTPGDAGLAVIVIAGLDRDSASCLPPDYAGCVVARRRLAFVEHTSLEVPVAITRDCLNVPCDTQTSCVHGDCKSSETSCDGTACAQSPAAPPDEDAGDARDDRSPVDGGADAPHADAKDDGDAQTQDAADTGPRYDGGPYTCTSSPSCSGQPAPCSCGGQVRITASGRMTMMDMNCSAAGPTCTCSIEGTFVKSIANPGSCQSGTYGSGCCSP